jgi:uncharacterized protein YndB with AHSA1/START domain
MAANDVNAPLVSIEVNLQASAEWVFDAWTKPEIMKEWLFRSDANEIVEIKNELQPGGAFSILEKSEDGTLIDHFGRYQLIDRPNQLDFSLEVPEHFEGETRVEVTITSTDQGCKLLFSQRGAPEVVEQNWRDMFQRLNDVSKSLMLASVKK